jgi:hypothetical protein
MEGAFACDFALWVARNIECATVAGNSNFTTVTPGYTYINCAEHAGQNRGPAWMMSNRCPAFFM